MPSPLTRTLEDTEAPAGGAPLYERVADHIAGLIDAGTLRAGARVPSVRRLGKQRGVSVSTVLQAYAKLEARGLIQARPQSGYYVRATARVAPPEPAMSRPSVRPTSVKLPDVLHQMIAAASDRRVVQLGAAIASSELLPSGSLNRMLARASRRAGAAAHEYQFPPGLPALREQIARRAMEAGCAIPPDGIVVTCGAQEALNLCLRAVCKPGDAVAVESPTFYGLLQAIEGLHLRAVEVPTHPREGVCLDSLADAIDRRGVRACLFCPNFNNPLGSLMPDDSKRALVRMLAERRVPLIEDDVYGELVHGPERPRAAKAFDPDGWVMWCASVSKTLSAGFRLGWVSPGRWQERVEHLKFTATIATPTLPQMVVAEFLAGGAYDRHTRTVRRRYAENVARMVDAVGRFFPAGTCVTRPQGGFVLWVEMPGGVDALELHRRMLARRIGTAPGPLFSAKGEYRSCLRLNCGLPWTEAVERAVEAIGKTAGRMLGGG